MKKTAPKKDNLTLIQILIIVALATIAISALLFKIDLIQSTPPEETLVDLSATTAELNGVNLDEMDSGLKQIETDSVSF